MKRLKLSLVMSILAVLLLSACGYMEQQDVIVSDVSDVKYIAQYNTMTNLLEPYSTQIQLTTEKLYYVREVEGMTELVCREVMQPEEEVTIICSFQEHQNIECFTVTSKREALLVVTNYVVSEDGRVDYSQVSERRMQKYSDNGNVLWERSLTEDMLDTQEIMVDSQAQIYLRTYDEKIYIYSSEGVKKNQIAASQVYNIASTPDGKFYLLNGRQVRELSSDTGQAASIPELERKKVYHTGQELAIIDDTCLYTYHPEQDNALCKQINLLEHYVDASCVERIAMDGDGNIAILCREGLESRDVELILLKAQDNTKEEKEEVTQSTEIQAVAGEKQTKIKLQLAALESDTYARTIIDFNRASNTAMVEMMKLPGNEEGPMRIAASLLSENAPDVIQIQDGVVSDDYHKYADNGYLLDLTPYLESSEVLSKDDFADWVIEAFTVDGKLYALPTRMEFRTILVPTEYVEGRTNWNIEEYLEVLEKYPDAFIGQCTSKDFPRIKELCLEEILYLGIGAFVDRENGTAYMDGERFRNILERLNNLQFTEITSTIEERVDAGELIIARYKTIKCNRDIADAEWIQCRGKDITLMGYPTPEAIPGEAGANMMIYYNILGITSTCKHPEEAWKFIERNLMKAMNADTKYFPTGKEALEVKLQEETAGDYHMSKEEEDSLRQIYKNRKSIGVITQKQVDKVRSGLENASWYDRGVDDAILIILEEVKPYFAGQKSLDETVRILQSRMQVYLDEIYK